MAQFNDIARRRRPRGPSVILQDVTKRYIVKDADAQGSRRLVPGSHRVQVNALRGVSLVAHAGEFIGILGENGSGKSTMLRLIAGGESPSGGTILVRNQPLLLGISAALQPHLSGAKNVRLGCLAMGMTPQEADAAFDEIVELSGLGEAIYRPMRTYSSGMGSRLRFAIATATNPEILLIDEALSAGDAAFAERAEERMKQLLAGSGTVFLVSHAAQTIETLCTRAVWLHKGQVIADGPARETARAYRLWAWRMAKNRIEEADQIIRDTAVTHKDPEIRLMSHEAAALRGRHRVR